MKCLILAAGYATRLYPLTENFPKPLLELGGKPILEYLTDDIDKIDIIDSFVLISNHRYYDHFVKWAKNYNSDKPIEIFDDGSTDNATRCGAVRDLQMAIDEYGIDEDILVIGGDNLIEFSFAEFINYAKSHDTSAIMRYYEPEKTILQKCGVAQIDEDGRVIDMVEKPAEPVSNWAIPPFYIYKAEDLALIKQGIEEGCGVDAPGSLPAYMCKKTAIYAMEMKGVRYDVGDLESYNAINEIFSKK